MANLQKYGYSKNILLSINITPQYLVHPQLQSFLCEEAALRNLKREQVQLEITEDFLINNISDVMPVMMALRDAKFRIALDDFGTGFSSLAYLTELPVDCIKLDKRLIDYVEDAKKVNIVKLVTNLCKALNIDCVAEGVERQEQVVILKDIGIEKAQGYLFSRPKKLVELAHWSTYIQSSQPETTAFR